MKWWRQLRAAGRVILHLGVVLLTAYGLLTTPAGPVRWTFLALTIAAVAWLVRAAFVYIPGFDPFFRVPWRGPRADRRMAITFDDGPNGPVTEEILRLFDQFGAKATFFMVGQAVEAQPDLARAVAAAGHAVGSHTYSHAKLHRLSVARMREEVDRGHRCLEQAGIPVSGLFRAPHGLKTFGLLRHLTRRGLRLIAWTDGVYDTDCPSDEVIYRRALRKLRAGEILLLHDGKQGHERGPLLRALPRILQACRERGLALVTVPELLGEGAGR
jgi:peptidoglycan/xylan/chitin deacetylase (PgdA/CDA1 family)